MFILRKQWSTVLVIALILVVVVFAVLNVDPVNINFGFAAFEMPLVVVIIGTLLIGVLIAVMWSTTLVVRERNHAKKLTKQMDQINAEVEQDKQHLRAQFTNEKQEIESHYKTEKENLQTIINNHEAEIRELNRRIKNMETSRTVHKSGTNQIL